MTQIHLLSSVEAAQEKASEWNFRAGVALVPTMGFLHEGHLQLIREARRRADTVVVSIFVNPLQFGPTEDFARYPRNMAKDMSLLEAEGVDYVFAPTAEDLTPSEMTTVVDPGTMASRLCGEYRPGHFAGVCTIVAKLFQVIRPGTAIFGWKDAQQFLILRKMVKDLAIPVELIGLETERDRNGLALSSRNAYLTEAQMVAAPAISAGLNELKRMVEANPAMSGRAMEDAFKEFVGQHEELKVQYVRVVSMENLEQIDRVVPGKTLIAVAVFAGNTRLIDNIRL